MLLTMISNSPTNPSRVFVYELSYAKSRAEQASSAWLASPLWYVQIFPCQIKFAEHTIQRNYVSLSVCHYGAEEDMDKGRNDDERQLNSSRVGRSIH